jgi:hypothetical protein
MSNDRPTRPPKLKRLFRSERGIWRYEIERPNGDIRWSSLHTRDEQKARALYARMEQWLAIAYS